MIKKRWSLVVGLAAAVSLLAAGCSGSASESDGPVTLTYITTGFGNFWGLFSAFIIVAFVPVLAIFVAFQRWFIAGMTSGGVKG